MSEQPADQAVVIAGGVVATVTAGEHDPGYVVVRDGRIEAVGAGAAPELPGAQLVDATGCLVTPGLINTHHHFYQWVTRGLAVDDGLFGWLTTLYPIWAGLDADVTRSAAAACLGWLARTGCTTASDHHYVFPANGGDLLGAEIDAAAQIGVRLLATRGSMDLGQSQGGLPPDHVVERTDTALAATAAAVDAYHDPGPDSMVRIGVAPCSPFSVTRDLLAQSAALARDKGVRLHTHLAETQDEDAYCRERFGASPLDYLAEVGWLADDVWFAHGIHFDDAGIAALAEAGAGVAHCPTSNARLGAGICRFRDLRAAGVPVGLGVDGTASNESGSMVAELHQAVMLARAVGGPTAVTVRDVLEAGTIGSARLLGWDDQVGSLEPGKQADLAVWRLSGLAHADIVDPVAALVLGDRPPLDLLLVAGRAVVRDDRLVTADEDALAADAVRAHQKLINHA